MAPQLQNNNSAGRDEASLPVEFITVCVLAFITSVLATAYFCRSICTEIKMPGGWTMSMMWMQTRGETRFMSTLSFLVMWIPMMVAMMMPSALPMFVKTSRKWGELCYMASGYFAIWLIAGIGIYVLGVTFAMVTMWSELISRAVPLLSFTSLIVAGVFQFTRLKMTHVLRCRSAFGCGSPVSQNKPGFRLGCKQGAACCLSCMAPLTIQLVLGLMNPIVMIAVAIIIAVEKLLPRPEITTRLVGIATIFAGFTMIVEPGSISSQFSATIVSCAPAN